MKDCKKIHPLLSLYQEGELSAREKAAVEKHVSGCPVARAELDRLERLHTALKKLPEPKLPHDLHDKIMARLGKKEPKKNVLWFNPVWTLTAAALALIVLTQYPRFTSEQPKETLAINKTTPAGTYEDSFAKRAAAANKPAPQPFLENRFMVAASSMRRTKKRVPKRETTANADLSLDAAKKVSASNVVAAAGAAVPPTMVVAMAPVPAQAPVERAVAKESPLGIQKKVSVASTDLATNGTRDVKSTAASQAVPMIESPKEVQNLNVQINGAVEQTPTPLSGNFSPVTVEGQQLITDNTTFQTQWNQVQQGQPLPSVDFTTQAVVLLNAGNQPTTGYSIKISRLEETAGQLIVHYQIGTPIPGAPAGQMVTRPWSMQVIPKPAKPVVFLKD